MLHGETCALVVAGGKLAESGTARLARAEGGGAAWAVLYFTFNNIDGRDDNLNRTLRHRATNRLRSFPALSIFKP